jgi:ankyrin repeat protein
VVFPDSSGTPPAPIRTKSTPVSGISLARDSNVEMVKLLLKSGADPAIKVGKNGMPLLDVAKVMGNKGIAELILTAIADRKAFPSFYQ